MREPYRVFVVLDRGFGERLLNLAETGPVWIVGTPSNREAAEKVWATHNTKTHLAGVTTFDDCDCSAEDLFISQLDTIDLHHGIHSSDPPYTELEVIGVPISERLKTELAAFGFNKFESVTDGFRAARPLPGRATAE